VGLVPRAIIGRVTSDDDASHDPGVHRPDPAAPMVRADDRSDRDPRTVSWTNRLILGFVVVVGLVAGWFIATAFAPLWWAERVADVADGSLPVGLFAGLACGLVFTAVPLAVLRPVLGRRVGWGARWSLLVLALLVAVPNLITLTIVTGTGEAAHAADLALLGAPGFPGATAAGAVLGAVGMLLLWSARYRSRRRRRELQRLRTELSLREREDLAGDEDDDLDPGEPS
jgi:hypothetical protein